MRSARLPLTALVVLTAAAMGTAGCAGSSSPSSAASSTSAATTSAAATSAAATSAAATSAVATAEVPAGDCPAGDLPTRAKGVLTVGTDNPAYEPWFSDNKPANGKGFESAVAYAVASKLGYDQAHVKWTVAAFNTVVAPGPKRFDFDINEVSITDERKAAVDFSSGYYDVTQAIIALKSSPIAKATSIADLKGAKLGAQVGTTSYQTIKDVIAPTHTPSAFDTNDIAKAALKNGQIDGIVVDLPTAFYITGAEITDATIVGQFADTGANPEQFGLVLDKGSKLTTCVSAAVDALRADGTLAGLQDTWLASAAGAPVLK